jgi:hypothetical protein
VDILDYGKDQTAIDTLPAGAVKTEIGNGSDMDFKTVMVEKLFEPSNSSGGGLPAGGTRGQLIVKQSGTSGDALWENLKLTGGGA